MLQRMNYGTLTGPTVVCVQAKEIEGALVTGRAVET